MKKYLYLTRGIFLDTVQNTMELAVLMSIYWKMKSCIRTGPLYQEPPCRLYNIQNSVLSVWLSSA